MNQLDRQSSNDEDTLAWVIEGNRVSLGDLTGLTLGDFQVGQLVGRGGMGEVYMATQISLNRPVALKVLRPDYLTKGAYLDRFKAEATAIAKLNHPNIVHVYAIGNMDDVHYIAMEYVEGTNLRDYLRKKGAMELPQVLSIMKQTCQAIGAAGEAGIVHRDIKPENILVTKRGRVKVADFGLCRDQALEAQSMTQSNVTMGTPLYMSPEQAQGHPVDHRSDLYSLGVTYYFMIAGEPPFRADSAVALALKHVREIPRSLVNHRPDLPLEIDRLVMKLMSKDPADRYQSAAMVLADLGKMRDLAQVGASATISEPFDSISSRGDESSPPASRNALAVRTTEPTVPVVASPRPNRADPVAAQPIANPSAAPGVEGQDLSAPRFSMLVASAAVSLGLIGGALAGYAARAPDLKSLPADPSRPPPGLWIEPRWSTIPKQKSPEDQLHYALLQAPRDEWVAAWLAVPGYFRNSHESASKAYAQVARLWYRLNDVDALAALTSELAAWDKAQKRDKDLVAILKLALDLKKGDTQGVEKGFKGLTQTDLADMHDSSLVALSLEVCSDALKAVLKSGPQSMVEPLRREIRSLAWRLNRIEGVDQPPAAGRPNPAAGRPNPAAGAAARSNG